MCIGIQINTGEKIVATPDGIIKVRSIRRKLESERWRAEDCANVKRYPWKQYDGVDDDQVHIRPPLPTTPPAPKEEDRVQVKRDGETVPRPFSILRRDLVDYGYTPGCPGCYAAANDRRYRPHTINCRQRIEKAMLEDEQGSNRIKEARAREDAYLEERVRLADEIARPPMPPDAVVEDPREVPRAAPSPDATMEDQPAAVASENEPDYMKWEEMLNENNFLTT